MTPPDLLSHLWIIGPGRVGLTLADELRASGRAGRITIEGRQAGPPEHPVFRAGEVEYVPAASPLDPQPTMVVLAVPDSSIEEVARSLVSRYTGRAPVLHVSGATDLSVLDALAATDVPVGSVHPLVAVSGQRGSGSRLRGAWYAVEGRNEAAAAAARAIVEALGGRILTVTSGAKPAYHAATVFASNFVVTLLDVAERLLVEAGVPEPTARQALTELARGAVSNVSASGPVEALTGPVSRGDDRTVALHLSGLSADDRALYSTIARRTLELARRQGLPASAARRIAATMEMP